MRTLIRLFIVLPVLVLLWGTANTLGLTTIVSRATGLPDVSTWTIPGLDKIIEARELVGDEVDDAKAEAQRQARQAAIRAIKAEVRRRYGPEAASLIPNDLTIREAKNYDFEQFEAILADKMPDLLPDKPDETKKPPKQPRNPGGNIYAKALKRLDTLAVKGKAPMTGYDRDEFGPSWSDAVGNWNISRDGIDTRNNILSRDLKNVECAPNSKSSKTGACKVLRGVLAYDPYSGAKNYVFDSTDDEYATDLDIEHVVALGNAWVTGAFGWDEDKRALIANDPLNLMAVNPSLNRQKSDADYATWLPPNKAYRCDYAVRQIKVKAKYGLWVTKAEKSAMKSVLSGCA